MTPPSLPYSRDEVAVIGRLRHLGTSDAAPRPLSAERRARLREALVSEADAHGRSNVVHLWSGSKGRHARSASA